MDMNGYEWIGVAASVRSGQTEHVRTKGTGASYSVHRVWEERKRVRAGMCMFR